MLPLKKLQVRILAWMKIKIEKLPEGFQMCKWQTIFIKSSGFILPLQEFP